MRYSICLLTFSRAGLLGFALGAWTIKNLSRKGPKTTLEPNPDKPSCFRLFIHSAFLLHRPSSPSSICHPSICPSYWLYFSPSCYLSNLCFLLPSFSSAFD